MKIIQAVQGDVVQLNSSDWYIFDKGLWRTMTEDEQLALT